MDDQAPVQPPARVSRRRRRILAALAALMLGAVALVGALPWLLGTAPARRLILGQVNRKLAPGSVGVEGLSLSWTGPIRLSGVALRDPKGKVVLAASSVRTDRGILGLLRSRPDYGTVTVEGAAVDVERRPDGSIDALDALGSALKSDDPSKPSDPDTAVVVVVKGGPLRVASPELVEPIAASTFDGTLTIAPGKPMAVVATLVEAGRSLGLRAGYDHRAPAGTDADLSLALDGKGWPVHARQSGVEVRGRLDGTMEARREGGRWSARSDASLAGVEVSGPALAGDRLAMDRVALASDAGQTPAGWSVRKLEVQSPVALLSASGSVPATEGAKLHGTVDLAALAKMMPRAMRLRDGLALEKGTATIRADLSYGAGVDRVDVSASLDDVSATEGTRPVSLREPAHLAVSATRSGGKIAIEKVELKAAGLDVTASGDLEAGVKLSGTVDLARLDAQARDLLDLGKFSAAGRARVAADYRHAGDAYKLRFAAEVKGLDVAGLTAEPVRRDLARVDVAASGPRSTDGLPTDWSQAQLDLKSADVKLDLAATHQGEAIAIRAGAGLDVASPTPGRAEVKVALTMRGRAFEVEELLAGLTPADPASSPGSVALAVRGRLDLASGEGEFTPLPGLPAGAVGLMPEGIRVVGLGRSDVPTRVDAAMQGDLAALDRLLAAWSGSPARGLGGAWGTHFKVTRSAEGRLDTDGQVDVPGIIAPGLTGPVSLAWRLGYAPDTDRLEVGGLNLSVLYTLVAIAGDVYEVNGRRILDLKATVDPKWGAIDPILIAAVEPGARFRATIRPIHWKGVLKADSTAQLLAQQMSEVALDVTEARAFGVTLGPAPVVLHLAQGKADFDPIRTTANGGPVVVNAGLALDDALGLWLRVLPGTKIEGAEINDAVSSAILAYVAPVLSQATQVRGKVSVDLDRGLIPITAAGSAEIDGKVVFQDVQCLSGPLGSELASLVGRPAPRLALQQPMQLKVAGGRVSQSGLSVPIGGDAKVALDGSVGFDKTLDLKATVPLSSRMLGLDPRYGKLVEGTKLAVPVRGTMARPAIDRRAFAVALRDAAKGAAGRGIQSEAAGLLERVAGPNLPGGGELKGQPGRRGGALGELENLGRELIDPRKKP